MRWPRRSRTPTRAELVDQLIEEVRRIAREEILIARREREQLPQPPQETP